MGGEGRRTAPLARELDRRHHHDHVKLWLSHCPALVWATNGLCETTRVLASNTSLDERMGPVREMRKAYIDPAAFDVVFAGRHIVCTPDICETMADLYSFGKWQNNEEAGGTRMFLM